MPNWVLSVEELTISLTGATGSANLSLGQTIGNCFVMATASVSGTSDAGEDLAVELDIVSGPNRVSATRFTSVGTIELRIKVIEVDPTQADVQKGTFSIGSSSTSDNVTISSLTTTDAFIVPTQKVDDPFGDGDVNFTRVKFTSSTNVEISRGGTGGAIDGTLWVVEALNSNFSVQHNDFSFSGTTSSVTLTAIEPTKTFNIITYRTTNNGDNPDENMVTGDLTSTTNYDLERYSTNGTLSGTLQTVTLADQSSVQRGQLVMTGATASDTETISPITPADSVPWLEAIPAWGYSQGRTDSASSYEDGLAEAEFDDASTLRLSRDDTGAEGTFEWEVIDFALVGESANGVAVQSSLG